MKHPLEEIPGVGPQIAANMEALGIRQPADLAGRAPEELYRLDCLRKGYQEDRCALYLWRAAVYYADHEVRDPKKVQWPYWKDKVYRKETQNESTQ